MGVFIRYPQSQQTFIMQASSLVILVVMAGLASPASIHVPSDSSEEAPELQLLRNFESFRHEVDHHTGDGTYSFVYHVGDSEREEVRSESGEVSGRFAFVAPEGDEIEAKYEADDDGFRVESAALPVAPKDTDDVREAKELFFAAYERALEAAGSYEYDEESSEESSEESTEEYGESSEESSEEDSDER